MEGLVLLLVLVCPIVMGGLMIWMIRSMRQGMHSSRGIKERDES
jgi:hypothetical protein